MAASLRGCEPGNRGTSTFGTCYQPRLIVTPEHDNIIIPFYPNSSSAFPIRITRYILMCYSLDFFFFYKNEVI
jgi:hypothetical protein